jgi:transcription elongation GreA/GreB family factor
LTDQNAYVRALQHIKELRPDDWPQLFAELLPVAPIDGCDFIAQSLREAGHDQLVTDQFDTILSDFTKHLDAVCWIYRGGAGTDPIPIRELLTRLLDHLGGVMRSELASADTKRQTREKVRSALAANKYARFRQVIQEMDAGLASTIRTTVQRLDGLGQVVHSDLNRIVLDTHPKLRIVKQKRVDPWDDDKIIFTTRAGYNKREDELKYLRNVKIPENARAIGEAASHGDLSENSEYKFALEERDLLQARAAAISGELAIARTLTANDVNTDTVEIGTRVTLASKDNDFRATLTILGPFDADVERGIYNYRAPMCGKLRHLKVGDTVELDLEGTEKPYRIAAIENALVATPQTDNANASSST